MRIVTKKKSAVSKEQANKSMKHDKTPRKHEDTMSTVRRVTRSMLGIKKTKKY